MPFLYFAAGLANPITPEILTRLDLAYAFDVPPAYGVITGRTPSGGTGTIFTDATQLGDAELAFRPPGEQKWRKRPGDDGVWIGYWEKAKPTPAKLARTQQVKGSELKLADGNRWLIPKLEWFVDDAGFQLALPCYYDIDEQGKWIMGEVDEEYASAVALVERIHAGVYQSEAGTAPRLTTEELLRLAPRLLQINYRVGPLECAMLRLFKKGGMLRSIAEVAVDFATALDWLEKKSAGVSP